MATDAYGNEVDDEIQYQQNQQQPIPAGQQVIAGPTPAPQQAAPAYDTKGAYEGFRNDWLGQGFGNQTNADNLAKTAAKYGYTVKGGDKVYDAQGGFVGDMIGDIGGRSTLQFLRGAEGHATTDKVYGGKSTPKTPPGPTNKPPAGGGGGGGATGGGAGGGYTGNLSGQSGDLFNLLMERAKGSENVDPNDPIIKAQTDAYRSEGVNARRDFLAAQAEAAGPYGNQRSEERRSAEQLGKSVGGFQGQAMQNELSARRAKIEHALDSGAQFLSEQQRMALQNELTRLQLAQQESQFGRNLKQQGSQFDRNLAMQKDQFGRSLGQRAYEYDTSRWDDIFL